jgi:hypothetical protein
MLICNGWDMVKGSRERSLKRKEMDLPGKANDGRSNEALFSGIAGDFMQQVVLYSDWCALGGNLFHRSTLRDT